MATSRIKKSFTNIPKHLAEVGGFLIGIAREQVAINMAKREAKLRLKEIEKKLAEDVGKLTRSRDTYFNALFAFAGPRKKELTAEARTVTLPEGNFGWRWTPPSVVVKNGMSDTDLIAYLKKHGLSRYVRIIEEVDREALLAHRIEIPVVAYEQREEFFAKPVMKKGDGSGEELKTDVVDG